MPVIQYERPLSPGCVRISRNEAGGVTIAIAPDSAKRTAFALFGPLAIGGLCCLGPVALIFEGSLPPFVGFAALALILAVAGFVTHRIVVRSAGLIIFRADVAGIQIVNPLDARPNQLFDADQIVALQLHRVELAIPTHTCQLELRVRALWKHDDRLTLLVSQSAETLDKIGRTLCKALDLPEPCGDLNGWMTYRPPPAAARRVENVL
jgi:hypothetical protein